MRSLAVSDCKEEAVLPLCKQKSKPSPSPIAADTQEACGEAIQFQPSLPENRSRKRFRCGSGDFVKFQNAVQHERGVCSMAQELINNIAIKVVDNVDVMLGYWDRNLKCQFANAAYQVWFGKSRRDLLGSSIQDLLGPLYEMNLPYILAALEGKAQVFERTIPLPDGSTRHSLASYYPDIVNGEVCGFTVQVTDVTRLKRLEFELQEAKNRAELMATHDFLTGLPNRVLLMDRIEIAMAR